MYIYSFYKLCVSKEYCPIQILVSELVLKQEKHKEKNFEVSGMGFPICQHPQFLKSLESTGSSCVNYFIDLRD